MPTADRATPGAWPRPPQFHINRVMGVIGVCALDFMVVGPLIRTWQDCGIINVVVGITATGYFMAAFLMMIRPERDADVLADSTPPGRRCRR
jgi:hypothetical protein